MKVELKTDNENYFKSFSNVFFTFSILAILIIFGDVALKLGIISRHYQINYKCKLLSVEKSTTNFKNLSKISKLKNKQSIWEFCREVVK